MIYIKFALDILAMDAKIPTLTVIVVQLVEHRIVVPGVVGSSPIGHPIANVVEECADLRLRS